MKNENLVPKVRFKGFSDPWEQRKLKNIAIRVRGNDGRMELPTLTISATQGWLNQKDRFSENIAGKEQKNYTLLKKGQLSYNHGNSKTAKYGAVFKLDIYTEALVPRVYHSFTVKHNNSADFIEYLFATGSPNRELRKLVSSGARMDGLLNISFDAFFNINLQVPIATEQMKIAKFFRKTDNLIAANEDKLEQLKTLKKLMMQKIFSQEWRFKGFTDPWEQRKLGELFNERKEKSSQGELLSVTINSGIVKFDTLDRKNNSSADKSNYRVVRYGDIAYNSMRMWQGASGLSMYNGIVSPAYTVITPRTNTDAGFMAVNFKRKSMIQVFQRNSQGLTSDTWNLKFPVLKNIRISIPKITEQQIITELFTVINNLIAANEDKLNQLKKLKKYLMQNMFV
ncbi:restriction endonuclease subunit S [Lactiplantibacillus plantarum]|uniref:restriction endonuclease subunit S n=1 Tax=Lactiplantibacillus plantarum TaxID=1590 RepID=UPI001AAF7A4B|nr:restriction endonuclease subunit S [Lactiplantibacillus plantarum]MBO2704540.1 restriction endonuclease subunit S [Lactiplantibacillus plantarum]WVH99798.1 restriction endonuclease subunit S [Lactiplantibacillus plantarum]